MRGVSVGVRDVCQKWLITCGEGLKIMYKSAPNVTPQCDHPMYKSRSVLNSMHSEIIYSCIYS